MSEFGQQQQSRVQLPRRDVAPVKAIGLRVGIAAACIVITTVLTYIGGSGYRDNDGTVDSWLDALYYATVSLSTTGYGDITPVTDTARWINVLVITPLRLIFLIVLVGTTVEVLTQRSRDQWRQRHWRRTMQDHAVIVGYGVKGRSAVATLISNGADPRQIVVVTSDPAAILDATSAGVTGVLGDATREAVLRDALVETAARVVVATDSDDTSVLVTLTARRLNPHATIVAAVRESQNSAALRQSGANALIPTAEAAGQLLSLAVLSPIVGEYMEDLLDPGTGLELCERPVTATEVGVNPATLSSSGTLVLAVVRGDITHRFDNERITTLAAGDRVVVIERAGRSPRGV